MKKLILFLLLFGSAVYAQNPIFMLAGSQTASTAFPAGSFFNEDFRASYQNPTLVTETGNPTENSTPPGSPPAGLPSKSLHVATTSAASYAEFLFASNSTATRYHRFWLYITSHSMADGGSTKVYKVMSHLGDASCGIRLRNNAGQLELDGNLGTAIPVSTGQWYRVILKWVYNSSTGTLSVYDNTGTIVTSAQSVTVGTDDERSIQVGSFDAQTVNLDIVGVGIDDTGPLSP